MSVNIGQVIRNAIVFDFRHHAEDALRADSLPKTVGELFALLDERRADYALAGGIALLQYVEGRNTDDINLIMSPQTLERLPEIGIASRDADCIRSRYKELPVDLHLTCNCLFDEVQRNYATQQHFAEQDIRCVTVEGLILLKLYALPSLYRQGNFARVGIYETDVATLIQAYHPPLAPLLAELAKHLSDSDITSVRDILAEIEERIKRFGAGLGHKS